MIDTWMNAIPGTTTFRSLCGRRKSLASTGCATDTSMEVDSLRTKLGQEKYIFPVSATHFQTYQTVNFLLSLKEKVNNDSEVGSRLLCLLVICSQSLEVGWREALEDNDVIKTQRHWKPGHKLSVLSLIGQRTPPSIDTLQRYDIIMLTAHDLQTPNAWFCQTRWYTVIADEAHEFLRGQSGNISATLMNWYALQRQAKSIFLLTGTPYTTNIKFDVKRILQAIASNTVRQEWGPEYSDDGIEELLQPWNDRMHGKFFRNEEARNKAVEQNSSSAGEIAKKMSLYTIRRDENSRIRGKPILRDYVGDCKRFEDPLELDRRELQERMTLYNEKYGKLRLNKGSTETLRCLAYSLRYPDWVTRLGGSKTFWNDYTLQEARSYVRTRRLIEILREGKQTGNRVVVFCHRVFLLELSAKVQYSSRIN